MIIIDLKRYKFLHTSVRRDCVLFGGTVTTLNLPLPYGVLQAVASPKYINSLFQHIKLNFRTLVQGLFLEIIPEGVGYKYLRYTWAPKILGLGLGYSHFFGFKFPTQCLFRCNKYRLFLYSGNRSVINEMAYLIIRMRIPDAYKAKGLKFPRGELKLKPGKLRQR